MKIEKQLAALALCLMVLWASRFLPYSCDAVEAGPPWQAIVAAGGLLTIFLFVPAYDFIAFVSYKLGRDQSFEHLDVYPGDPPVPNARPISLKTKLLLFYPLDLAIVIFFLLPLWTKCAYWS